MRAPHGGSPISPDRRLPWALYPKLVSVSVLLGGFVAAGALILAIPRQSLEDWRRLHDVISPLFTLVIVPASFATVAFSVLLFWPRRRALLRQRWMQVKLALLVLTLPALHLLARGTFTAMRREVADGSPEGPTGLLEFFLLLDAVSIAVVLAAMWLGRAKPRGAGRSS